MTQQTGKRHLPIWQESILLVVTAVVIAVVVKTFFVQAFYIPSGSMEPTMVENDRLLVQKVSYWFDDPQRGDIVVFDDPGGWLAEDESRTATNPVQKALEVVGLYPTGGHLIKRVVGVGGDTVRCCTDDGRLSVDGTPVTEKYPLDSSVTADSPFEVKVPKGYLWVMGDNRDNSADSRAHLGDPGGGFVPVSDVVGKAWLRVWPFDRFGLVKGTDAFDDVADPKK